MGIFGELADNASSGCIMVVFLFSLFFSKLCHHVSSSQPITPLVRIRFFNLLLIFYLVRLSPETVGKTCGLLDHQRFFVDLSFSSRLDFSDISSHGINLLFAVVKRKINCKGAALVRGELRDSAELSLYCSI